jgi:regulator of protease activity HflC (stomatin/prohibitin superfamily)
MASSTEVAVGVTVELFLAALALGLLYRVWGKIFAIPRRQTVLAFQQGAVLLEGRVEKVLKPGRYWITPKRTLVICDMRPKPFQILAQEMLTADGMGVRMSLSGEYRVSDSALFLAESSDAFGAFYLEIRQALHLALKEFDGESIFSGQALLTSRIKELLVPRATQLGIELTKLDVWEAVPVGMLRPAQS